MTVEAVIRDVERAADEPFDLRRVEVPLQDFVPPLNPGHKLFGLFSPESFRVLYRAMVHLGIQFRCDSCLSLHRRGDVVDQIAGYLLCHVAFSLRLEFQNRSIKDFCKKLRGSMTRGGDPVGRPGRRRSAVSPTPYLLRFFLRDFFSCLRLALAFVLELRLWV